MHATQVHTTSMSVVLHEALPRQTVAQSTDSPQKIVLKW